MPMIRAAICVSGRVQGVCYRRFTQQSAQAHGVTGWVTNMLNGDVTAVLEGEEHAVKAVLQECRQGPQHAYVEHIDVDMQQYRGEFDLFTILR